MKETDRQKHCKEIVLLPINTALWGFLDIKKEPVLVRSPKLSSVANTGPHYQKLYARVTHIWGNRKGQPDRSAMKGPHLERAASLITVPPASGKFFVF